MRMLGIIAYIMRFAIGGAIETVALASGDVDGIGETVFAQGIGEIPESLGMTGLYIIQVVVGSSCQGTALHLAVKMEFDWQYSIGYQDELAEETAATFLYVILHLVASRNTQHDVAIRHRTIAQAGNIRCQLLAVHHQTAQIFVGAGMVGTSAVHPYTRVGGIRFYQGNLGLQINVIATIFLLFSAYSCRKVSKKDKIAAKSNNFWDFMLDIVEKVLTLQRI